MDNTFSEEDRADLIERGFNDEQIEYLESLDMDAEQLYFDICHIMDDFGDTPNQIIQSYMENNEELPPEGAATPAAGGGKRKRKTRKRKTRKNRKTRKTRKTRKIRKTRRHKR